MTESVQVISRSQNYVPALIYTRRLDELWLKEPNICVSTWSGPPHNHWFEISAQEKKVAFIAAYASLDGEPYVGFTNGMHRTRWLIQSGQEAIPLNIPPEEQEHWQQLGLLVKPIFQPVYLDLAKCRLA